MSGEHWYGRDGSSQYDADLRRARKEGLVPSVTTVLSVVDKAALTSWLVDQGIMAALTGTRRDGESDVAYIARVKADSKLQAQEAAAEGTRIHDACEKLYKIEGVPDEYLRHAQAAQREVARLFPNVYDWMAEKSFAHQLGFGGKVDLHSPSTGIVVDFKTKDGDFSDGKKLAYDQHWQLAAYQIGLRIVEAAFTDRAVFSEDCRPCANIFISRTHPGAVASKVWTAGDIAQGWDVFAAALTLWKRIKKYDGSF